MITLLPGARKHRRFTIGVLTKLWGRATLSWNTLVYYAMLEIPNVELLRLAVRSPEDDDPAVDVPNWNYLDAPNLPLSNGWNAGLAWLMAQGVDAVVIVGSDDFLSATYWDLLVGQLRAGADVVSARDLFVYTPGDDYVSFCRSMSPGAGRAVTAAGVRAVAGKLWESGLNRYLDAAMSHRLSQVNLRRHNARHPDRRSWAVLDVKLAEGPAMWRLAPGDPLGTDLVADDGSRLHIRQVVRLPAREFFTDYFPAILNPAALGTGNAYEPVEGVAGHE